jgi:hypothetical protein
MGSGAGLTGRQLKEEGAMARMGIQTQGDLAENARLQQHARQNVPAVNLNAHSRSNNFVLYDVSTREGFESVKAYADYKQVLDHLAELQASQEWASSKQIAQRNAVAKQLLANAESLKEAWPKNLPTNASHAEVVEYGRNNALIVTCDDTAQQAKAALPDHIRDNAPIWDLDPHSQTFEADVQRVAEQQGRRIVGCGMTSVEIMERTLESVRQQNASGWQPKVVSERAALAAEHTAQAQTSTGPAAPANSGVAPAAGAWQPKVVSERAALAAERGSGERTAAGSLAQANSGAGLEAAVSATAGASSTPTVTPPTVTLQTGLLEGSSSARLR